MPPDTPSAIRAIGYSTGSTSTFRILPSAISFWARRAGLLLPSVCGVQPRSSWRARAPAMVTNSNALPVWALSFTFTLCPLKFSSPEGPHDDPAALKGCTTPGSPSTRRRASNETSNDPFRVLADVAQFRALGENDRVQPLDAGLQFVVHDHVLVLDECRHFIPRGLKAALHRFLRILAAATQPLLQDLEGWRQHEDANHILPAEAHLPGSLHVDDQDEIDTLCEFPVRLGGAGSV